MAYAREFRPSRSRPIEMLKYMNVKASLQPCDCGSATTVH